MQWLEAHDDIGHKCSIVVKVDCVSHVSKNFAAKLETLVKNCPEKLSDGKSVNRGTNRLGKIARVKLQKTFRNAVRTSVRKDLTTRADMREGVDNVRKNIYASLYHSTKLDGTIRHKYCPNDSWCLYKTGGNFEDKPHHIDAVFLPLLLPIYEHYTQDSILQRMLPGYNTNINESFNSLLWSIIPKNKYHGKQKQESATMLSLMIYQNGYGVIDSIVDKLELPRRMREGDNLLLKQGDSRVYHRNRESNIANAKFETRLKEALAMKGQGQSGYEAGILDAGDTITAALPLNKSIGPGLDVDHETSSFSIDQFVSVSYGPKFYVGQIKAVDAESSEVEIQFMSRVGTTTNQFVWIDEGQPGYEHPSWEYFERVLCCLEPPGITATSSNRFVFALREGDLEKCNKILIEKQKQKQLARQLRKGT